MNNRLDLLHYVDTQKKRKEVTKHKVEGSPFKYSFWHDLSQLFYSFKYYLYQVILDISVLKSKFLLIKMITIDNWNFMTDSRRVFLQGFYASVIMRLTDKKFQPIKNYFLFKKYQYCLLWYNCNCIVEVRAILSKFSVACMCEKLFKPKCNWNFWVSNLVCLSSPFYIIAANNYNKLNFMICAYFMPSSWVHTAKLLHNTNNSWETTSKTNVKDAAWSQCLRFFFFFLSYHTDSCKFSELYSL